MLTGDAWFTKALTGIDRAGDIVSTRWITFTGFTTYREFIDVMFNLSSPTYLDRNSDSSNHFHIDRIDVLEHLTYMDSDLIVNYIAEENYHCDVVFPSDGNCKLDDQIKLIWISIQSSEKQVIYRDI